MQYNVHTFGLICFCVRFVILWRFRLRPVAIYINRNIHFMKYSLLSNPTESEGIVYASYCNIANVIGNLIIHD